MIINFLSAMALVFIFEGMIPFIRPDAWKKILKLVMNQSDKTLRIYGFCSMMFGVVLLAIVHQFIE